MVGTQFRAADFAATAALTAQIEREKQLSFRRVTRLLEIRFIRDRTLPTLDEVRNGYGLRG